MNMPEFVEKPWPQDGAHDEMCNCPDCGGIETLTPSWWDTVEGEKHKWRVGLRCVECLARYSGVFSDRQICNFDELLDRHTDQIQTKLREMEVQNMAEYVDVFSAALQAEVIQPDDF